MPRGGSVDTPSSARTAPHAMYRPSGESAGWSFVPEDDDLLAALGIFVIVVASHGLITVQRLQVSTSPLWAGPAGLLGGIFSAMYGTGGPIYTIYLARRLADFEQFRATTALLILTSAACRLLAFLVAGLLFSPQVWRLALWAVPTCLISLWLGTRLRHRLNPQTLRRLVLWLLLASGAGVLWRASQL